VTQVATEKLRKNRNTGRNACATCPQALCLRCGTDIRVCVSVARADFFSASEQTVAHLKGSRRGSERAAAEFKISPCLSITLRAVTCPVFLSPSGVIQPLDAPALTGKPSPPPGRPRHGDGDPGCGKTVPPIQRTSLPGATPQRESNRVSGYQPSPDRETGVKSKSARSGVLSLWGSTVTRRPSTATTWKPGLSR